MWRHTTNYSCELEVYSALSHFEFPLALVWDHFHLSEVGLQVGEGLVCLEVHLYLFDLGGVVFAGCDYEHCEFPALLVDLFFQTPLTEVHFTVDAVVVRGVHVMSLTTQLTHEQLAQILFSGPLPLTQPPPTPHTLTPRQIILHHPTAILIRPDHILTTLPTIPQITLIAH